MQRYEIFFIDDDGCKNVVGCSWFTRGTSLDTVRAKMRESWWDHKYDESKYSPVTLPVSNDQNEVPPIAAPEPEHNEFEDECFELLEKCLDIAELRFGIKSKMDSLEEEKNSTLNGDYTSDKFSNLFVISRDIESLNQNASKLRTEGVDAIRKLIKKLGYKDQMIPFRCVSISEYDAMKKEFGYGDKLKEEMKIRNLGYPACMISSVPAAEENSGPLLTDLETNSLLLTDFEE